MWFDSAPEDITRGFHALIATISGAIGAPDHDERRSNGDCATWWIRPRFDIEFYLFAERPNARAGAQISVNWKAADSVGPPAIG